MKDTVKFYTLGELMSSSDDIKFKRQTHRRITAVIDRNTKQVVSFHTQSSMELSFAGMTNNKEYQYIDISNIKQYPDVGIGYFYLNNGFIQPYSNEVFKHVIENKFKIIYSYDDEMEYYFKFDDSNDDEDSNTQNDYTHDKEFQNELLSVLKSIDKSIKVFSSIDIKRSKILPKTNNPIVVISQKPPKPR